MKYEIASLTIHEDWNPRPKLNQEKIVEYSTILDSLPPVSVLECEEDGNTYLADGFHRLAAARLLARLEIEATCRTVKTIADVQNEIDRANFEHGLSLSLDEKHFRVWRIKERTGWT